jgi:drug/metabolite transporter (DMT)-like permease
MNSRTYFIVGLLGLLVLDTFTKVSLKYTTLVAEPLTFDLQWLVRVLTTPWVYCAILGYLGAFVTWMTILRRIPVGPAFAATNLELVGVMVISAPLFGEVLSGVQYFGAVLIIAGVLCIAYGEPNVTPGSAAEEGR